MLLNAGIENYCPTTKEIRQWSDRKKKITKPLIPRYIFVFTTDQERQNAFVSKEVIKCLFWQGKPAIVPKKEMETLQYYLDDVGPTTVQLSDLKEGNTVVINYGDFKGKKGIVRGKNPRRVKIEMPGLGLVLNIETYKVSKHSKDMAL